MKALIAACLLATVSGVAQATSVDTLVTGRLKAETCLGCHGIATYKNAYPTFDVPKLGGQSAEYIISALKAYQVQDRGHSTMHAQAYSLSEQDMAEIAAYFSSLTTLR
jgi:cytochrome c553